jgi:poly(3-hydroxybutyrate) depolymerase
MKAFQLISSITIASLFAVLASIPLVAQETPRPAVGGIAGRFNQLDRNSDGKISREEGGSLRFFDTADKDRDGFMTFTEAEAHARQSTVPNRNRTAGMEGDGAGPMTSRVKPAEITETEKYLTPVLQQRTLEKLKTLHAPVLILHGDQHDLHKLNKPLFLPLMKEAGVKVEYREYPGYGHGFYFGGGDDRWGKGADEAVVEAVVRDAHSFLAESMPAAALPGTSENAPTWVTRAVTAPRVQFRTFDSAAAKTKVSYHIYTPAIYDEEPERNFPVLYWLHGTSGGLAGVAPLSAFFDRAIREKKIPPMLVVFPNGLVASMWCDSQNASVPMEAVIIKELLPHIDATFRTVAKREARIVEGFSMGGYGAARLGFKHHDLFAGVSILAGGPLDLELQGPKAAANPVGRERILRNVFGGDLAVFQAQSPWVLAEQHAAAVRGKTRVRMAIGERDFTLSLNRKFSARLKDLSIPHTFTMVPGVGHDTMALLNGLGEGNWEFYSSVFGLTTSAQPEQLLPPGDHQRTIKIGERERSFLLHVPPGTKVGKPLPLVIMLHGGGGTAENAVKETGWSTKADAAGFLVAYPNATPPDPSKPGKFRGNPQTWTDASGRFPKEGGAPDDVAFVGAMIDDIAAHTALDRKRIFVTGFSNGASMAFAVGAGLSERIAAIAPVAGACWLTNLKLKRSVSLCYVTGTADPLNPIKGGPVKLAIGEGGLGGKDKPPVQDSILKWVKAVKAPVKPAEDRESNGVRMLRYGPSSDGAEVVFITIEGQGHVWPGGKNLLPEFMVGKATDKLKAVDVIWEFFEKHPLKPSAAPLSQPTVTP